MSDEDTTARPRHRWSSDAGVRAARRRCGSTRDTIVGDGGLPAAVREPGPARARPPDGRPTTRPPAGAPSARSRRCSASRCSPPLAFIVGYFAIDHDDRRLRPRHRQRQRCSNLVLGLTWASRLLGIGIGAVHWAKTLMPDEEVVEERHLQRVLRRQTASEAVDGHHRGRRGGPARPPPADQVHPRRRARPVRPAARRCRWPARSATCRDDELAHTIWDIEPNPDGSPGAPIRLMRDPELTPIKVERRHHRLGLPRHAREASRTARTSSRRRPRPPCMLMRLDPARTTSRSQKASDWGYQGIVAYSKICTHVGCPVGLYEQQTHHLLCPCHQSTFDVTGTARSSSARPSGRCRS